MTLTRTGGSAERAALTFAQAAEQHLDDVYGYLLYLARDRETAEDLASATFEKALRLWGRFDPRRGSARTWLLGIARTTALDWFRAEGRRRRREEAAAVPERVDEAFGEGLSPALEAALADAQRRRARGDRAAGRPRPRRRHRRPRARHQPDGRLDTALPGAQTTRGKGDRA